MGSVVCNVVVIWFRACCSLMSLVASDKEGLEKSLDVLVKWCEEWGGGGGVIRITVGKSGIMHMSKKMHGGEV